MMQPDLFTQPYPNSPGFADTDTSIDAAQDMEPKAPRLRQMVLDALYSHGGLTADEAAGRLEKRHPIHPATVFGTGCIGFNCKHRP